MKQNQLGSIVIGFAILFQLIAISFLPATQDEAYYFYWSLFPDLGYFDHPPLIAWLSTPSIWFPDNVFWSRILGASLNLLMIPLYLSLATKIHPDPKFRFNVLILSIFSLGGLVSGIVQTPDLPLAFFWLLALHESYVAMTNNPKRWITAGIATGLGIASKYTMLIIGLVFLWALIREKKQLSKIWPYLGGLACLLTLLPHLHWNHQHDWVSFKFQMGRGFLSQYEVPGAQAHGISQAIPASPGTHEDSLKYTFYEPSKVHLPKQPKPVLKKTLGKVGQFFGGQLGLWGLLLFPIGLGLWRQKSVKTQTKGFDPGKSLIWASVAIPIVLFAMLSPIQHIEANWAAISMIGMIFLLASLQMTKFLLLSSAILNSSLIGLVILHSHSPLTTKNPAKDRILRETSGYEDLALNLKDLKAPVLADTYQTASLLNFYQRDLLVSQWPGIARMSELVRRREMIHTNQKTLEASGIFYLITFNAIPPIMDGFSVTSKTHFRDCLEGFIIYKSNAQWLGSSPCPKPIHKWYLYRYQSKS